MREKSRTEKKGALIHHGEKEQFGTGAKPKSGAFE
jgi:hypothetical protein